MTNEPYNPLAKLNLARSIEYEILQRKPDRLADVSHVIGAGVYALYYVGDFAPYARLKALNIDGRFDQPIYVGKAIPKGGRKGGLDKDASTGDALRKRLREHARSIDQASNLDLGDFFVRHLVVDDIWIPLGENGLIETFKPVWNRALDGFGSKATGVGRLKQVKSAWDTLHPGKARARRLPDNGADASFFVKRVEDYLAGREMAPLPKALREQEQQDQDIAEDAADEA